MAIVPKMGGYSLPSGNKIYPEYGSDQTKGYKPGGKNKIIWGGAVSGGSSGGNTSYNAETGQVEYISGYENDADEPSGGGGSASSDAGPSKKSGGKSKSSSKKKKSSKAVKGLQAAAPQPSAPAPVAPPVPGAPAAPGDAPAAPGLPPPAPDGPAPLARGLIGTSPVEHSSGGDPMGAAGMQWLDGPEALRRGLGNRIIPMQGAPLAGLGRALY